MSLFRALPLPMLLLVAACGEPVAYNAVEGPVRTALPVTQLQQEAVGAVNTLRTQAGLPPLAQSPLLQTAAQGYAAQPGPGTILERARGAGYGGCVLTETLASGQGSVDGVIARWMSSPTERAALMSPSASELGLGVAPDPAGGNRWALALGTPC